MLVKLNDPLLTVSLWLQLSLLHLARHIVVVKEAKHYFKLVTSLSENGRRL